ncbi:hypothetical protein PsYK624_101170 [Phanerochaete sordida]|uniref:Uncharacterized protein n=1 Tax=Phanerochaete sordida TaxID=48140 RepID=A0A9P3GFG2_9APHY|nr:hypothetical protein PsYK624_101170 [Phanerochaete sordida]
MMSKRFPAKRPDDALPFGRDSCTPAVALPFLAGQRVALQEGGIYRFGGRSSLQNNILKSELLCLWTHPSDGAGARSGRDLLIPHRQFNCTCPEISNGPPSSHPFIAR